ncbi:MAG: alpha/beta hydrolase [Microcoleus sp. PH2017_29_MFU_D_A]|uniref:alpha/beta fold hydrolase n=1 Tax=unclassified Microcoleus TaxID=2642155 RepID=UPI001DDDE509|nr:MULTISPECIES: alpha/beta hydrolase [unclassified Microcoleus]MCC3418922.1 alpha/beta hydrolase [Microcoleus sp. PH2017_07_MST_O_A]MCC3512500.1 alpha/beta hydrolase [Microcoleus sp. PH2017_17_BER_D_A]TAE16570.1 MAG: alpha/beta hydrolase [Oscillatoriales cyanobacterium]MCC3410661.1 alpha/beta hydrolase [Microcoleus sp. PH2017_02_FOX_O_A]MCC3474933.1 alpha/beta hydrolase [Microcoleus sp. PH2017_13_LAR_U_A]
MPASFLPKSIAQLTESTSIALAKSIQVEAITTSLSQQPIATTYARQGSGNTPILLIHGFDSSVFEYRRLLPLLAEKNETWAVDLLGFGFTERAADLPFSQKAIGSHLYYFWKTLISQPVILVGASMGGAAAIDFTLNHPEAVKKLVLIDSAGFAVTSNKGKFLIPPLGYLATSFLRNPIIRQKISVNAYFDKTLASVDAQTCAALHLEMPNWNQALIAFTKSGGYGGFGQKLSQIQQQTLILWGKQDRILGTADAEKFKSAIANSQLIWIPDCGHVPHLEKPQITAQHILDFIAKVAGS